MSAVNAEGVSDDDILHTTQLLYEHLALNILSLQPPEILSPFLLMTDETNHRVDTLQQITTDILLILRKMAEIKDASALDLTWFGHNEQIHLEEAFKRSFIHADGIWSYVNYAWDELRDAQTEGYLHPSWYNPPAQKIYQNLTRQEHLKRDKLCQKLGEHHLGNVYPLGDDFKEWYLRTNREERSHFLAESMRRIIKKQSLRYNDNYWPVNSGYADIVLDDRVKEYWRSYIGQAGIPLQRFIDHLKGAMRSKPTTLHYFVIWKGLGYRSMNFLRLWTLPGPDSRFYHEEKSYIFSNVLEMVFCRVFQSLPQESLQDFFPEIKNQVYAGLGLNIMSPLYQGFTVHYSVRHRFALRAELSQDPEIQEWPSFRTRTQGSRTSSSMRYKWDKFAMKQKDYLQMFMDKFREQINGDTEMQVPLSPPDSNASDDFDMEVWCHTLKNELGRDTLHRPRIVEPIGTVDARIGIILNEPVLNAEGTRDLLPFGFQESGFIETNSLIWCYDPRQHSLQAYSENHEVPTILAQSNSKLIKSSNLQVVLLDQDINMMWYNPYCPHRHRIVSFDLQLYCGPIKFYVEITAEDDKIKRVYDLRPYYTSTRSSMHHILWLYRDELDGADKMTVDDVHWAVEPYLHRRGFRIKEDMRRLEEIGGTLIRGVLLVLHALRRTYAKKQTVKRTPRPVGENPFRFQIDRSRKGIFTSDEISATEALLNDLSKTSETDQLIPNLSRIQEASTGNTHDSQVAENSGEEYADTLIAATEDDLNVIPAVNHEVLGTADVQEMARMGTLVTEKQAEILSTVSQEDVAELEIEDSNMLSDAFLNQIIIDNNGKDLEESLEVTISEDGKLICSIEKEARPLRKVQKKDHTRELAQSLLQEGRYYTGTFDKESEVLKIHPVPAIAGIHIYLYGRRRRQDWPKEFLLKAHIHPGRCHPQKWALNCRDDEPAAKLAFSITSEEGTFFVTNRGPRAPYQANTFIDWVSGDPIEALLLRPRRHIHALAEHVKSLGLPCIGTWYTDEIAELHQYVSRRVHSNQLKRAAMSQPSIG
ncbi:hypothetical protein DPV78_009845 [Talaromyces pinophilus]|nr:hypothetical protein DPV78_009845 [Talaromyces pinophilus]